MTFDTAARRAGRVLSCPMNNQSINAVTMILRPEYYVLPLKHPSNCRCSEHQSKLSPAPRNSVLVTTWRK
jgi:hypothetical protein